MTCRVTVLLAVYNGGAYLHEAVASVLDQTYEDFELLLIDDASTDGAVDSLPADERIRILRNDHNIGQIPSLNRGLNAARGEYVARLDHDDVCLPRRLELQVALLESLPHVALTATWADVVESDGRLWTHVRPEVASFADFVAQVATGRIFFVHPTLMFRRDVVTGLGGFDESLNASEDQDLYRRLVLGRHEARVVAETMLLYRRHEQQMTVAKSAAVWESDERSYDRFLSELSPGVAASALRKMLRSDPRFWTEPVVSYESLETFVGDASDRLRLDPAGRAQLGRALAKRAAATMLAGWSGDATARSYPPRARVLARFVAVNGDATGRLCATLAPILAVTAPASVHILKARTTLTRALRSERIAAPRRMARRSRMFRRLYARVADTRERR